MIGFPIYDGANRTKEIGAFLNHLRATYNVEGNKFHTACWSANSSGIFKLVGLMADDFQGITGMAGNPGSTSESELKKLKGVRVQFVVGDKDPYWMKAAQKRHEILTRIGVDSQIEIIKNGQHVMTNLIGEGFLKRAHRLRN